MASLKAAEIEDWLVELDRSNSTKNQILFTFRIVLLEAVRQGILRHNVAKAIEGFGNNSRPRSAYEDEEITRLFPSDNEQLERLWGRFDAAVLCYLSMVSGARHGELRALQWKDVYSTEIGSHLHISKAVKRNHKMGPPKNGKARVALINSRAAELLKQLWKEKAPVSEEDFIFSCDGKAPFWENVTHTALRHAFERAGIDKAGRQLDIHSFRHTFITKSRRGDIDDVTLRKMVGHQSVEVTNGYDHRDITDDVRELEREREPYERIFHTSDEAGNGGTAA